jgi:hypothetical protein
MKIENFNEYKLCNNPYCSKEYTHTFPLNICGCLGNLNLCEEHYWEMVEKVSQKLKGRIDECQLNFLQ